MSDYKSKIYLDERLEACDDKHRQMSLETLALNYQLFGSNEESEEEAQKRQEIIWKILDEYYKKLPDSYKETADDKTWRLFLARMDRRKMKPTIEKKDDKFLINLNPEIAPELKKHSEEHLKRDAEMMSHIPLSLWAQSRFNREDENYKKYPQYENDLNLVIKETKNIIDRLNNNGEENFVLFKYSIPAYSCAVLLRDYFDSLNEDESSFCKNFVLEHASLSLNNNYKYKILDGVGAAVSVLSIILKHFAQDRDRLKRILLFTLFDSHHMEMDYSLFNYAMNAVLALWKENFEDANSMFLGYLLLKPKYNKIMKTTKNYYERSVYQLIGRLVEEYENEIETIISNNITYEKLPDLKDIDLGTLATAFQLLPLKTENKTHKKFLNSIFSIFSEKLFSNDEKNDYNLRHRFLQKLSSFILTSKKEDIETYLKPFLDDFRSSRNTANFFYEFVIAEDSLNKYEEFWIVWDAFYPKIVEICKDEMSHYYNRDREIVYSYLFASISWRKDAKHWDTLKVREKYFFDKVAKDIGNYPAVLYSIAKLLNGIGNSIFSDAGVSWISSILKNDKTLSTKELDKGTIFEMDNFVRGYILNNRKKFKPYPEIKKQIIVILNFLVEQGSVAGYLLREDIL
ncbi:hypothetical protein [Candidatus Magnetobacterium casense]|uniref:Uncharacterized protein n=1 Tax=Candidatus Magnetobacterium casense TaxID=1455061 RepID=A0ABS6RYP7_9BACT|nr:hypothetical protein [Candidatus Magnetobacterium casensis]MBV6341318.1 hypothetical protein [Candidatus Magnetobacterium casensis]